VFDAMLYGVSASHTAASKHAIGTLIATALAAVPYESASRPLERNIQVPAEHSLDCSPAVAPETGVLLHVKYLQDFHARAVQESARGEHWDGASEYRRYAQRLSEDPSLSLMYEGSTRFEGTAQLVRMGSCTSQRTGRPLEIPELSDAASSVSCPDRAQRKQPSRSRFTR
jgi:hypothetical protein